MKGHTKIIKVDGTIVEQDWTEMPGLEFWQAAVGGHIEAVPYWPTGVAFCNEEGKLKRMPINQEANRIWAKSYDVLVGDIVQVTGDDAFMRAL